MTLDEFLQELGARRGLHRKIGLLARYWRQVQGLPAEKQQQIALALGSKAAWGRLEKLFAKDGTLSDGELAVKRALDRVGRADPDELRDLAAKVRSGNYADVSKELVEAVGQALDEEADADETGRAREDTVVDGEAEPADTAAVIDELAAGGEAAYEEAAPDDSASDEAAAPGADPTDEAPHVAEAAVAAFATASSPPPPEVVAEPAPPAPQVVTELTPPPLREVGTEPGRPLQEVVAKPTPQPLTEVGAEPYRARAPTLSATEKLGVLRALRDDPGYGARLGRSGRAQLLARLGPGSAARRALSALIRSRAVDDLDEALRLTGTLHSEVQKTWCLGDLVQHWTLDEAELERVVRTARSSAATNRLRRRYARQSSSRGA